MITEKSPARGGSLRQGINKWTCNNRIPISRHKVNNRYLMFFERLCLVKMLSYGISDFPENFTDKRNKLIASNLSCFLEIYPVQQHTLKCFLSYLVENSFLENCGGEKYIEEIFEGIGEGL